MNSSDYETIGIWLLRLEWENKSDALGETTPKAAVDLLYVESKFLP